MDSPSGTESPGREDPLEVALLPFLTLLGAAVLLVLGTATLLDPASGDPANAGLFVPAGWAFLAMGAVLLASVVGLWNRASWGWWLAVGVDLAYVGLVVALNLSRPPPDATWLLSPAFAGLVFLWLFVVREEFGVSLRPRASPPPS